MKARPLERSLAELDDALEYCGDILKLKVQVAGSRFRTHHRPLIERLCAMRRQGGDTDAVFKADPVAFSIALTEAEEFVQLLPLLRDGDIRTLRPRVEAALLGPPIPTEEDKSNKPQGSNKGRNALFELVMAAKLKRAGYEPILAKHPDLACDLKDRRLLIECKRPASEGGLRKLLKDAGDQLAQQLRNWKCPAGTRGVIAISLTKVFNPGDKFFPYKREEEAKQFFGESLRKLQEECDSTVEALPAKVIGIFWHVITPAIDETSNMFIVAQHTLVHGVNRTSRDEDAPVRELYERLRAVFGWS